MSDRQIGYRSFRWGSVAIRTRLPNAIAKTGLLRPSYWLDCGRRDRLELAGAVSTSASYRDRLRERILNHRGDHRNSLRERFDAHREKQALWPDSLTLDGMA